MTKADESKRRNDMTKAQKVVATDDAWEEGALGADAAYTAEAPAEIEARIDQAMDLQMISIRLPKALIEDYKYIATKESLKYQTLMKQALQRFIVSELKRVARSESQRVKKALAADRLPKQTAA